MSRAKYDNLPESSAQRMKNHPIKAKDVEYIITKPERFKVNPPYQRKSVWTTRFKQQLIDSVLRGYPIGVFTGFDKDRIIEVLNGHQRTASFREFSEGRFRTATAGEWMNYDPTSKVQPVEPGRYYYELSKEAQECFLTYEVPIVILPNEMDEWERSRYYLLIQNQEQLKPAERIRAYPSLAIPAADQIAKHKFWNNYRGQIKHGELFRAGLWLLAIEMMGPYIDLTPGFEKRIAGGAFDEKVTSTLIEAVVTRLDVVRVLYFGLRFNGLSSVIPMYQSVMLLEKAGYTARLSERGKLRMWLEGLIEVSNSSLGIPGFNRPIPMLVHRKVQEEFWGERQMEILRLFGIVDKAA